MSWGDWFHSGIPGGVSSFMSQTPSVGVSVGCGEGGREEVALWGLPLSCSSLAFHTLASLYCLLQRRQ